MRRQVSVLVAVVGTAIVASFVIPLLMLVQTLAEDRGMAAAREQANSVAVLVSSLHDQPNLQQAIELSLSRSAAQTSVVMPDGTVLGATWPAARSDPEYQKAMQGQAYSVRDAAGGRVYVPVIVDGGVVVVRSAVSAAQLNDGVPLAWASIITLGIVLSAAAVLVAARMGRRISQPLVAVTATAHLLRAGDLDARAPVVGTSETVELGKALNGLAERIEELLAAERDNVGGLAHRLRTPVTAIRLESEQVADPQLRESLAESVADLQAAIDDVVRNARRPLREGLPGFCDARVVVAARVDYWLPLAEDQGRDVSLHLAQEALPVGLSALQLADVVDICLDNVFAHTPEQAAIAIDLARVGDHVELTISDDGPGFPASPEPSRRGTSGAGLRIVRKLVNQVHGQVATSGPGVEGGRVSVVLPIQSPGIER